MTGEEKKYIRMTTAPVYSLVAALAVPSIVCMLITSIYNMADTYFVSRLNTQSIAAVGIIFSYTGIIQSISFFFGHGSGNFISRALGARKTSDAESMAVTGLISAMLLSLVVALLCILFKPLLLHLLGSTDTIYPYASAYFDHIVIGTPFISGSIVLNNQMRLQGNAQLSMIGIMSGALLNILLDPLFIFVLNMGVAGAGLATAISQAAGFFILLSLTGKKGGIRIRLHAFAPSRDRYGEIIAGGLPSLTRQGLMFMSTICLNNIAAGYGDSAVASFSVVSRIMSLVNAIIIGFGQGFQPVCGFNYGARIYSRVRQGLNLCVICSTVFCILVSIVGIGFGSSVISFFNGDDGTILEIGSKILLYQCLAYPVVGFVVMTNMFLQNIRRTGPAVLIAAARQGLFFIPIVIIGSRLFGMSGLMSAQAVSDVCSFIVAIPLFRSAYKSIS